MTSQPFVSRKSVVVRLAYLLPLSHCLVDRLIDWLTDMAVPSSVSQTIDRPAHCRPCRSKHGGVRRWKKMEADPIEMEKKVTLCTPLMTMGQQQKTRRSLCVGICIMQSSWV